MTAAWGWNEVPEPADVLRLARRLLRRVVQAARAEDEPVRLLLAEHLGPGAAGVPVVTGSWQGYDHVNLQVGLDAWLAGPGRSHTLTGLTGFQHTDAGLAELMQTGAAGVGRYGIGVGSVAMTAQPSGPGGQTRGCVQCGLYLVNDGDTRLALLLRGPDDNRPDSGVSLEVACASQAAAQHVIDEVRKLALARNVFRGQVVAFGGEVFGPGSHGSGRIGNCRRSARTSAILSAWEASN